MIAITSSLRFGGKSLKPEGLRADCCLRTGSILILVLKSCFHFVSCRNCASSSSNEKPSATTRWLASARINHGNELTSEAHLDFPDVSVTRPSGNETAPVLFHSLKASSPMTEIGRAHV